MSDEIRELLLAQYLKLELELLECLELYEQAPKKRLVHQMRVNFKKQLAFLVLTQNMMQSEAMAGHWEVIRAFQKRLGKVRDCQVQRDKANQIEANLGLDSDISDFFKDKETDYQVDWLKFKEEVNLTEAMSGVRVLLSVALEQISPAYLEEEILGQFRHILFEIKCLSNIASFNTDAFHELRTYLKRLTYTWNFLQPHYSQLPIEPAFWDLVRQLEQALGEWHDYQSLLKKVDAKKHEAFAFVAKDYLEDYSVRARALLPLLDELVATIEPLFLSKNSAPTE